MYVEKICPTCDGPYFVLKGRRGLQQCPDCEEREGAEFWHDLIEDWATERDLYGVFT